MMKGAFFLSYELSQLCDSHSGTFDFGTGPLQIGKRMTSVSLMKVCCEEQKRKSVMSTRGLTVFVSI